MYRNLADIFIIESVILKQKLVCTFITLENFRFLLFGVLLFDDCYIFTNGRAGIFQRQGVIR